VGPGQSCGGGPEDPITSRSDISIENKTLTTKRLVF
jgi:hypothetical protein